MPTPKPPYPAAFRQQMVELVHAGRGISGMVERFNGRISEIVGQTRFASAAELDTTLTHYLATYNHLIPQRALKHQTPIQALKTWQLAKPDLFVKRVYKQTGLDNTGALVRPECAKGIK